MKAIFGFDAPESCAECPLKASYQPSAHSIRESWCVVYPGLTIENFQTGRSEFCPLKIISDDAPTVDAVPEGWISVEDRLPECQQRVLAYYSNEFGKKRIELACYIPPKTVKSEDYLSDEAEGCEWYDEENDCYWVNEGWFEDSWEADTNWAITVPITHWMPLPKTPGAKMENIEGDKERT